MLDENQKKLFNDIEALAKFFDEDVITLSQYHEIKSKIVDNYLIKVAGTKGKKQNTEQFGLKVYFDGKII